MNTRSSLPRRQHESRANAPLHKKSKEIRVRLDRESFKDNFEPGSKKLKRFTLHKGDTVKIIRGSRTGHEGKVATIDVKRRKVSIEKALLRKADNKEVSLWFDPTNLVITKLELADPKRKHKWNEMNDIMEAGEAKQ
jgi:large subunit ribosomal protein L24